MKTIHILSLAVLGSLALVSVALKGFNVNTSLVKAPLRFFRRSKGPFSSSAKGTHVDFTNIYKDNTELPKDRDIAEKKNWKLVDRDEELRIDWFSLQGNPVQLAFDGLKGLAGARLVIPKEKENEFYSKSKIFDERTIKTNTYYTATVLLTDPVILKKTNGRIKTVNDEIVESVHVMHNGRDKKQTERILRNACDNADQESGTYLEQGCKNNFGLVFAPIKKNNEDCDYPLFFVYNEERQGDMLGFGWLAPASDIGGSQALTDQEIKMLFPSNPECLRGKTSVNIWLAEKARRKTKCEVPQGLFMEERCGKNRRVGIP